MPTKALKPFFVITLLIWLSACTTVRPTEKETGAINFRAIKTFALFSEAAYESEDDIRRLASANHYTLTKYGVIPQINIAYFLLTNTSTKTQLIGVRGTANIENAIVDATAKFIDDQRTGIQLHRGFAITADKIYRDLEPALKPDYTINTTGHSLGGAVAAILAMYLDVDHFHINKVITFGQPKVTNISGANKFSRLPLLRVVTPKDVVPLVPPFDPLDMNNHSLYWHPGVELVLNTDNSYSTLTGVDSMLRAANFTQSKPNEENLNNHKITYYLQLIENKLNGAHEVAYKYNFNLFNLFGS